MLLPVDAVVGGEPGRALALDEFQRLPRPPLAARVAIPGNEDCGWSAACSATPASRSPSTATPTCSRTPATHATAAPAWPSAHSPTCSSPPQPSPARQYSRSDERRIRTEGGAGQHHTGRLVLVRDEAQAPRGRRLLHSSVWHPWPSLALPRMGIELARRCWPVVPLAGVGLLRGGRRG